MTNQEGQPADSEPLGRRPLSPLQQRLHEIIFEADTPAGKLFDVVLLILIVLGVAAVMLESVEEFRLKHVALLFGLEWTLTILFTIEYGLRLASISRPAKYALSFFGIVDLLSFLPTYLRLFIPGNSHYLVVIRILRLLRLFRVFKMARYIGGANLILAALRSSRPKITVFLFSVVTLAIAMGTIMYLIEGEANAAFTSIPKATYWAIVTITTVGYGDIAPQSPLGQFVASLAMLAGYAIIAVPTGIVGAEIHRQMQQSHDYSTRACPGCGNHGHNVDARFCRLCGERL